MCDPLCSSDVNAENKNLFMVTTISNTEIKGGYQCNKCDSHLFPMYFGSEHLSSTYWSDLNDYTLFVWVVSLKVEGKWRSGEMSNIGTIRILQQSFLVKVNKKRRRKKKKNTSSSKS